RPGMAQETFGKSYAGTAAESYQRFFVPSIGAPVADDLIGVANLQPGERVLDVACGTGVVTRLAAARVGAGGAVAGLDPNPGMLAVAARTLRPICRSTGTRRAPRRCRCRTAPSTPCSARWGSSSCPTG